MNKILVHATGAKLGGAVTVINSYCEANAEDLLNYYYIFSPVKPPVMPKNSEWIEYRTDGLSTLFFSLLTSVFYYFYFKCDSIISFSNVNALIDLGRRVTYFHNMLICTSSNFKYKILRFILRYINQGNVEYIFQTEFVADKFCQIIGYVPTYKVCWPGVSTPLNIISKESSPCDGSFLLVPITDLSNKHKNFDLVVELASLLLPISRLKFILTCSNLQDRINLPSNIIFINNVSHTRFLNILSMSEGVIITSTVETVCLPIFEALSLGKKAYVYNAEYLHGLHHFLDGSEHTFIFNEPIEFLNSIHKNTEISFNKNKSFISGNWEF